MSIILRAALLGGIAYLITRSLSGNSADRQSTVRRSRTSPTNELPPGESNIWPTSESQQPAAANAGPAA